MKLAKSLVRFSGDPARHFQLSRAREPLSPMRLFAQRDPAFSAREVLPAEGWGLLVAGETVVDRGSTSIRIDPQTSPPGSTFFLHFEADGGDRHEQSLPYIGTEPALIFFLPQEWMSAAMAKNVTLGYEVQRPDGSRVEGPGMSFRILPALEISPIQIEGVEFGEDIDTDQLPETFNMTVERIRNLENFHGARMRFIVSGVDSDGWYGPHLDFHFDLDGVGDEAQILPVIRSWLSGPYLYYGYTDVDVAIYVRWTMLPPPNSTDNWGVHTLIGRNKVLPPQVGLS